MKSIIALALAFVLFGCAQNTNQSSDPLRSVLLKQLKTTHNVKEWFVPVNIALEDLTPEQAMWRDSSGNHSVGQLAYHLAFWNGRSLAGFTGQNKKDFSGQNDETFNAFNKTNWAATVSQLDSVLTQMEKLIETADEAKLKEMSAEIANICTHNAYHTGQIIAQRKLQGAWNPEKGVK
jgi:uncharacterized damage-inducible protein DinB